MKKVLQIIGALSLAVSLAVSAAAQGGGSHDKKPKTDEGKRPVEIVREPKNDQGRGGQQPRNNPQPPPKNDDRGGKPKKPNGF